MSIAQKRIEDAAMRLFAERGVTQVTVSELAEAAGVARGTIYNLAVDVDSLFEAVATRLTEEMTIRVDDTLAGIEDPAMRLATGIRLFVRRAAEEPLWARFVSRFGASEPTVRALLVGRPVKDVERGAQQGRLRLRSDQVVPALAMMSGSVLAAIVLVLDGLQTWRDAGSSTAELFLRALGVSADEARALSIGELPMLKPAEVE